MKHIARAALAGALVLVGSAYASDGTVTITGKIVGNTCTITNGNPSVTLPTAAANILSASGNVAGATSFSIDLVCKDGATPTPGAATGSVKAFFEAGPNVDTATGRLKLTSASTATNLQLQLLDNDAGVIKIGDASSIDAVTFDKDGKATLNYSVQYYATGVVTAGTANSSVTYSLVWACPRFCVNRHPVHPPIDVGVNRV